MEKNSSIYIAGHNGMVGSAILRRLEKDGYSNFILRSSSELDLRNQAAVRNFFEEEVPDYVFLAAAQVGGILANNSYPAEFIYNNIMIEANVIHEAYRSGVKKLLFLGSSCIYPKFARQPMEESQLLSGELEPTNEPYAVAKIAGIKMCQAYSRQYKCNFISAMPTNLYGENDNYDLQNSHVMPALIRKIAEAKMDELPSVKIWGTGNPKREFLHVDDLASACAFLMEHYNSSDIINVGTGEDVSIANLAQMISNFFDYGGELSFDKSMPDGTPRKLLDISKIGALGWRPSITLAHGIELVCSAYMLSTIANQSQSIKVN